jgi:hypothetical protein
MAWADRPLGDQVEIGYCAPHGIPLSVFRGRVVYPGEPQWTDDDRRAVYDWLEHEARTCSECRQDLDESMRKENSFAYIAEGVRCHACWAVAVAHAEGEGSKAAKTAGWRYKITKVGGAGGGVVQSGGNGKQAAAAGP